MGAADPLDLGAKSLERRSSRLARLIEILCPYLLHRLERFPPCLTLVIGQVMDYPAVLFLQLLPDAARRGILLGAEVLPGGVSGGHHGVPDVLRQLVPYVVADRADRGKTPDLRARCAVLQDIFSAVRLDAAKCAKASIHRAALQG